MPALVRRIDMREFAGMTPTPARSIAAGAPGGVAFEPLTHHSRTNLALRSWSVLSRLRSHPCEETVTVRW
jgi:hypothetical protein